MDIFKEAVEDAAAKLTKSFEKILIEVIILCCHGSDLMEAELNAIVDNGGIVHNVVIEHDVYGNLEGTLNLHSRRDIQQYIKRMHDSHAEMLSTISGGIHTHLVEAATEEELDAIGQALRDVGVLYKD